MDWDLMSRVNSDLWALRGIEPNVREAFTEQARALHVPVGVLANAVLMDAAERLRAGTFHPEVRPPLKPGPKTDPDEQRRYLQEQMAVAARKLAALGQ